MLGIYCSSRDTMLAEFSLHSYLLNPILEVEEIRAEKQRKQQQQHQQQKKQHKVLYKDLRVSKDAPSKLDMERARMWTWSHFLCNMLMCALVISGDSLVTTYYKNIELQGTAMWMAWAAMALGLLSALLTMCFFRAMRRSGNNNHNNNNNDKHNNNSNNNASTSTYAIVRMLLILHWTLNIVALFFVGTIPMSVDNPACWTGPDWLMMVTKVVYLFALVVMVAELVICLALLVGPVGAYAHAFNANGCWDTFCYHGNSVTLETEPRDCKPYDV